MDIDVVYADHLKPRTDALREIAGGLTAAQQRLKSRGIESELTTAPQGEETKLFVKQNRLAVKVEVNHVFRGTLLPVTTKRLNGSGVRGALRQQNCGRVGPPASA